MVKRFLYVFVIFLLPFIILVGCRDPFEPDVTTMDLNYLVVEGFIEIDEQESILKLSRTSPLRGEKEGRIESGAVITLISENGESWGFTEKELGTYGLIGTFDPNLTYKINILLLDNQEYESDPLIAKVSPPIQNVDFTRSDDGVNIHVSTQGNDEAVYFLWDYEETWLFRPPFPTAFLFNPATGGIDLRRPEQQVGLCWLENKVNRIVLDNAGRFANNRINQKEIVFIPNLSDKLMTRYSISVRQRAVDKDAFDFWEIMRKNTEDIGGIFSPLPSLISGNINPVNSSATVAIGFVSMGKSSFKRFYINVQDVRPWNVFIPDYLGCRVEPDTIPPPSYVLEFSGPNFTPTVQVVNQMGGIIGYRGTETRCADCTLRGSNVRPDFWED
ncbi:DUF4249 domain-containing protein [Aquiflexum sp.]|uniref:DUF4249 domain-containing protein n=1 Tax=Aquiflexum sp. TaxID=1872584 RepID=UPI00359434A0